jgi:hypothetical protein
MNKVNNIIDMNIMVDMKKVGSSALDNDVGTLRGPYLFRLEQHRGKRKSTKQ